MQRFTISLDDDLAEGFDQMIAGMRYENRSEAVRDMIRERLASSTLQTGAAKFCAASVSYVYDHHDHPVTERLMSMQHDHHDLVVSSLHTHLDHDHCLENVVLRGPAQEVRDCAQQLVALRGVRHGQVHVVALDEGKPHRHGQSRATHHHHKPIV